MTSTVYPEAWASLEGWNNKAADAVAFIDDLMARMNLAAEEQGFELHWHILDTHRIMDVRPYLMLGARRTSAENTSILVAFGFNYETARTWPKGFAEHYTDRICAHYQLFESGMSVPIDKVSDTELKQVLANTGMELKLYTLPEGFGRKNTTAISKLTPQNAPQIDPFALMEQPVDPFDIMETAAPGVFD